MSAKFYSSLVNINATHAHEEKLREESMALIVTDTEMLKSLIMIEKAMALIFFYTHDHTSRSVDEATVQMLGIRLFNAGASAVKLALSGYYQTAFALARDIMETGFLLDLFRTSPEKIAVWKGADDATLRDMFSPIKIRIVLDERDGDTEKKRGVQYKRLSELAAHASFRGFRMVVRQGHGEIGPFVEKINLQSWLQEMVLRLGPSAIIFANLFPNADPRIEEFYRAFGTELVVGYKK